MEKSKLANDISSGSNILDSESPLGHNSLTGIIITPTHPSLEWPLQSSGHLRSMELAKSAIQNYFSAELSLYNPKVAHKSESWDLGRAYTLALTLSAHTATP